MELRLISLAFALISLPASIYLLNRVWGERDKLVGNIRNTNSLLLIIFAGVALFATLNAIITFLAVTGFAHIGGTIAPYRTLFVNFYLSITCWLAVYVYKGINGH